MKTELADNNLSPSYPTHSTLQKVILSLPHPLKRFRYKAQFNSIQVAQKSKSLSIVIIKSY